METTHFKKGLPLVNLYGCWLLNGEILISQLQKCLRADLDKNTNPPTYLLICIPQFKNTLKEWSKRLWDTDYDSYNWEPEFMKIKSGTEEHLQFLRWFTILTFAYGPDTPSSGKFPYFPFPIFCEMNDWAPKAIFFSWGHLYGKVRKLWT